MNSFCDYADKILDIIVKYLKSRNIIFKTDNRDGRINSSLNEDQIIEELKPLFKTNEYILKNNYTMDVPEIRDWYDFAIVNKKYDLFIPVNIKVTNLSTDNLNCKLGIYFALSGLYPTGLSNEINWDQFFKKLGQDINTNQDKDYYFLVANKKNNKDYFYNSLKRLQTLTPNGNNLPFQTNWSENRLPKQRTYDEAVFFVLNSFKESIYKRASIKTSFDKQLKKYIKKYAPKDE